MQVDNASAASRSATFIRRQPVEVIIIGRSARPSSHSGHAARSTGMSDAVRSSQLSNTETNANLNKVKASVEQARDYFESHGFGAKDGNGLVDVVLDPKMPGAAYEFGRNPYTGEKLDRIIIGTDPESGKSYANADDAILHEYTHRVMEKNLDLGRTGDEGVVAEHLSDVFAAVLDKDDPWTIGEGVRNGGLRSMEDPDNSIYDVRLGREWLSKPDTWSEKIHTDQDGGGVHLNVGIPNKAAAYIGKMLGTDALGDIYMNAVKNHMPSKPDIEDTANAVIDSAQQLYAT